MERSVPSEEKLLKLIRKKSGQGILKNGDFPSANISGLWDKFIAGLDGFNLVNKMFLILALGLGGYIVLKAFVYNLPKGNPQDPLESETGMKAAEAVPEEALQQEFVKYAAVAKDFESRDLFNTSLYKAQPLPGETAGPAGNLVNPLQNLKLVGIVLDDTPEAILEDMQTKQTFFLNKGQEAGGIVVQEIKESNVVISYQGQQVELTLTPKQ